LLCALAIGIAFMSPGVAYILYLLVALAWLIPDRRIERVLSRPGTRSDASEVALTGPNAGDMLPRGMDGQA
jgi:hypothetical protein